MRGNGTVRTAALAIALATLAAPAATADWTHYGGDAGNSNAAGRGVRVDDVAFSVQLDELSERSWGQAFLVGDEAWVVGFPSGLTEVRAPVPTLVRVDLATAERTPVPLDVSAAGGFATDGRVLYGEWYGTLHALDAGTGASLWSRTPPALFGPAPTTTLCVPPAVDAGRVFLACQQSVHDPGEGGFCCLIGAASPRKTFVQAVDARTGEPVWDWVGSPTPAGGATYSVQALAHAGGKVLVSAGDYVDRAVLGLSATDGGELWRFAANATAEAFQPDPGTTGTDFGGGHGIASNAERIFVLDSQQGQSELSQVVRIDPEDGSALGRAEWEETRSLFFAPSSMAYGQTRLYVSSGARVHTLDAVTLQEQWAVEPVRGLVAWDGIAAGEDVVYVKSLEPDLQRWRDGSGYPHAVEARDAGTGALLWRREARGDVAWALGDEIAALYDRSTATLLVLGTTAGSIQVAPSVGSVYPRPGERVRVELAATRPGAFGPATEFRAEWGDGTATEWGNASLLEHAYQKQGDASARFQARNDAGQTSSAFVTFHVGAEPPNVVSVAFSPENQERTFFLLGLALTGAGALFGVTRVGAKRRRLARELAAIDKVHAATRHDPPACETALAERKAHARGLLVDGKIDEAQFALLERRIDELARDLRLAALDERFQYLPLGMVRQLRDMLADGRVTQWEREHFETALERERTMSDEQKAKVRMLVAEWFARDAAGRSDRAA